MMRKLAYGLITTLTSLLVTLLALVAWLAFTSSGGQWLVGQLPGLKVNGFQGQLANQWQAERVEWQNTQLKLVLEKLSFSWQVSCLTDRKVCLNKLQLARVEITTHTQQPAEPGVDFNWQDLRLADLSLPELSLPQLNLLELTQLKGLEINQLGIESLVINNQQQLSQLKLAANWQAEKINIQSLEIASPWFSKWLSKGSSKRLSKRLGKAIKESPDQPAKVRLTGWLATQNNWPLKLNLASQLSDYPLQLALAGDLEKLQIQTTLNLSNLSLSNLEEDASINLKGWVNLLNTKAPLNLNLSWQNLNPSQTYSELMNGLEDLQLKTGQLNLTGNLKKGWQLALDSQQTVNHQPVSLSLAANISWQALALEELYLNWAGEHWLKAKFNLVELKPKELSLDGEIAGQLKDELLSDLAFATNFSGFLDTASLNNSDLKNNSNSKDNSSQNSQKINYQFNLDDLVISTKQESLALALNLNSETWQAETKLELANLSNLAQTLLKRLKPHQAEALIANDPLAGDLKLNASLSLPALPLTTQADLQQVLSRVDQGQYHLELVSNELSYAANQLTNTDLNFSYLDKQSNLTLTSQQLNLATDNTDNTDTNSEVLLEAIKISLAGLVSNHQLSAALQLNKQPLQLSLQGGLDLEDPLGVNWHYTLAEVSTELIKPWLPPDLRWQDKITGELQGQWHNQQLSSRLDLYSGPGELAVKLEDKLNETFSWVPLTYHLLNLSFELENESLVTRLTLDGDQLGYLNSQVAINLKPDASSNTRKIKGHYQLEGLQIQAFSPFVNLDELKGRIKGQGEIRGHLLAPELWGNLQLEEVVAVNSRWPVTLQRLDGELLLQGEQLSLTADFSTGEGGDGQLKGELLWQPNLSAALNLTGEAFQVRVEPWANLQVTPDLNFSYQQETLSLAGKIKIPSGAISVKQLPKQAIKVSDDAQVLGREQAAKQAPNLNLDIELQLGNSQEPDKPPLSLEALGLNAEIQGRLKLGNELQTRGELALIKGVYQSWGQDLKLRKARLNFAGPVSQPFLDLEAVREVQDITVGIRITGRVDHPESEIFSEPPMANEQALSWLILGRPLKTEKDENTLNAAAISYGLKQASGVTERLGKSLGLKDFQLVAEGGGSEASVVASGYINDKLSVGYGVGVYDEVSRFVVRYELSRQVYIEAASALASSLDIFWRLNF
ncbi:translocation/assembly module TamB domain-containing protein [Marinospirillum insulare]|uniref:Translocation and assembly module TamB C-terminal domain-containing protein n=1 Tax=Marinospirillum insulare TaxID=217169 RepID=A0ABQ5ZXE6_9GAMM|nr:translocation/assembly module TamB domain-containing protein [Marinospirillum insulare]GLR63007.1 hypothetical protein GCM10007878_04420 [Marinospirillum insulare]